jgi:hypothetical protein
MVAIAVSHIILMTDLERAEQTLVDAHHGTRIVEFSAVIRSAEESHKLALGEKLVSVFHNLVRTANEVHVVLLQKTGYDVWAKREGDTSVIFAPSSDVLVRVGPKQVAQQTAVGNVSWTHDATNLLHGVQVGTQTSVHCENLLVDDSGDG